MIFVVKIQYKFKWRGTTTFPKEVILLLTTKYIFKKKLN